MGLVPRAIKEENKTAFGLSLYRMMGIVITMMIASEAGKLYVHSYFRILFFIYCIAVFIVLNLRAPYNPKHHMWQNMALWLADMFSQHRYLSIIGYAFKKACEEEKHE